MFSQLFYSIENSSLICKHQSQSMRLISLLLIIFTLFKLKLSIFLNSSLAFSSNFKTINAYCSKPDYSVVYFQSAVNNYTYTTTDGINIFQQTSIFTNSEARIMKYYNGSLFVLTTSNNIYIYNDTQASFNNSTQYLTFVNQILDFDFCNKVNNSLALILITSNKVMFKFIPIDSSPIQTFSFSENLQKINCLKLIEPTYCFISAKNRLIILDIVNPSIYKYVDIDQNAYITAFNTRINQSDSTIYLYLGLNTGVVKQYLFSKGQLTIKRQSKNLQGYSIQRILPHFNGNLIYIFSNETSYVNIITLSGYVHQSINFSFMANFSQNNDINVDQVSNVSIIVYNPKSEFASFNANLNFSLSISLAQPGLQVSCPVNFFFNQSSNYCQTCSYDCLICQKYTGVCSSCKQGYFLYLGVCKSCVYDNLSINYIDQCFTSTKLILFEASQSITPALVSGVVLIYGVFSGSSLIFIFYRLFNFWSLVSLYYFLPMKIPYLLQKLLQKIFNVYYSSIFQLFGIRLNITLNIKERQTNQKLTNASISTDFLQSNADNLIVFAYSVFLICTIFNGIKYIVKKRYGIQILEQVNLQASMQQFVGLFITFLIPLPFLINVPYFFSYNEKLNFAIQIFILGLVIIFPFLYLAAIQKRNCRKNNNEKVKENWKLIKKEEFKQKKVLINQTIRKQYKNTKSISVFNQTEGEKFLYCSISLATPFFVTIKPIQIFFFGGLILHYLSVQNALQANKWRINLFFHKTTFLLYHSFYIFMYYTQNEDLKFFVAALCFFVIIFGGLHELITAIAQKIAFIINLCKKSKVNKVGNSHDNKNSQSILVNEKQSKQTSNVKKINSQKSKPKPKTQIKIKQNLSITNILIPKKDVSKKRAGNQPLIFRTLKNIKQNKNITQILQQKNEDLNSNNKCSINDIADENGVQIQQSQHQVNQRENKKRINKEANKFQIANKSSKTQHKINKVQDESSLNKENKLKFKPIIITKKYIPQADLNSKKTIKQKIKLKWSNYVVNTQNQNKDNDVVDVVEIDDDKENDKIQEIYFKEAKHKSETKRSIKVKNIEIREKQQEKSKQMHKTSYTLRQ